jgi:hypothetical protein
MFPKKKKKKGKKKVGANKKVYPFSIGKKVMNQQNSQYFK